MIIKLNKINIERIKRIKYKKFEIKNKIIKVLKKDQNQNKTKKLFLNNLQVIKNNNIHLSKQKNICAYTGRPKFYIKFFRTGRHITNKFAFFGNLHNSALRSW